jgi:CheY-like chemotaxis protein
VRIYSEVGKGTTMSLYLPRFAGDPEATDTESVPPIDRGTGEVVLVVDDETSIRMLVMEVLQENGYAGIEAGDGSAGLRMLDSNPHVELLITDLGLPGGMNGRQLAEAARAKRPHLRVLFVTGFAENAVLGEGPLPQGTAVMTKPFVMAGLGQKIRELLDRS